MRFTSRKAIRESLTGRIVNVEVLPFSIAEAHQEPLPDTLAKIAKIHSEKDLMTFLEAVTDRSASKFEYFLKAGGLPGISFFREISIRTDKFEAHLDTLLNRDLRLIYETTLPFCF